MFSFVHMALKRVFVAKSKHISVRTSENVRILSPYKRVTQEIRNRYKILAGEREEVRSTEIPSVKGDNMVLKEIDARMWRE
jgi:hypothetical protein